MAVLYRIQFSTTLISLHIFIWNISSFYLFQLYCIFLRYTIYEPCLFGERVYMPFSFFRSITIWAPIFFFLSFFHNLDIPFLSFSFFLSFFLNLDMLSIFYHSFLIGTFSLFLSFFTLIFLSFFLSFHNLDIPSISYFILFCFSFLILIFPLFPS